MYYMRHCNLQYILPVSQSNQDELPHGIRRIPQGERPVPQTLRAQVKPPAFTRKYPFTGCPPPKKFPCEASALSNTAGHGEKLFNIYIRRRGTHTQGPLDDAGPSFTRTHTHTHALTHAHRGHYTHTYTHIHTH